MVCEAFPFENGSGALALDVINITFGSLSVLACLMVILGYIRRRGSLHDTSSMIAMLALSDMFLGINTILEGAYPAYNTCSSIKNENICVLKACFGQYFGLSSFMWSGAMAHSSFRQINRSLNVVQFNAFGTQQKPHPSMLMYHIIAWGIPLLSLIVVLATKSAGPSSSHMCWITIDRSDNNDSVLPASVAIILFVLPLVLIEFYLVSTFAWLVRLISRQIPSEIVTQLLGRVRTLLAVVVGMKFVYLGTRAVRLLFPERTILGLEILVVLGAPLQGLGDFLIFRASPGVTNSAGVTGSDLSNKDRSSNSSGVQMQAISRTLGREAYSTVLNPLGAVEDSEVDDGHMRSSAHSGVGFIDYQDNIFDDDDFRITDARDAYSNLAPSSSHNYRSQGISEADSEFDEVVFLDSPAR